jgi:hypothetical protein
VKTTITNLLEIKIDNADISNSKFIKIFIKIFGLFIHFMCEILNELLIKKQAFFMIRLKYSLFVIILYIAFKHKKGN